MGRNVKVAEPVSNRDSRNCGSALAAGSFNAKVREQIALAVAESNLCGYCLSAHAFIGGTAGLTGKDIADARHAFVVETGRVTMHGTTAALAEDPSIRQAYLGI